MPYSEVGIATPSTARLSWNTQFDELYDKVAVAEVQGRPWMQHLDSDVSTASTVRQETGLEYPILATDDLKRFLVRAHIIYTSSAEGSNEGVGIALETNASNTGSAYNARRATNADSWGMSIQNGTVSNHVTPTAGSPGEYPQQFIAILTGFLRVGTVNANSKLFISFRAASGFTVTVKAGSSLEVHSVL